MTELPNITDIKHAAETLNGVVTSTPLLESALLNNYLGGRIFIKPECLQRTGSFKFRGAFNKISSIPQRDLCRGVVAFSSGNHAQGVAHAAQLFSTQATIIMPQSAPDIKKQKTLEYGANVIEYDIHTQSREEIAQSLSLESGATLVKPYDDTHIMAGQGTIGLEICNELLAKNIALDQLIAPCGGGGLIAGISLATHHHFADCEIVAGEPENFDDTKRSLMAGYRVENSKGYSSICDAIITPTPGELTFAINQKHLTKGVSVSDSEVLAAMKIAYEHFNIVVEPGGIVGLAAIMAGKIDVTNRVTVVVCSGGNVDSSLFSTCLEQDINLSKIDD